MVTRRNRSRPTQHLLDAARERFCGCEVCCQSQAFDFIDNVLKPLKLKQREFKRLLRQLTCPRCESAIDELTYVAAVTPEELREWRLTQKFILVYGHQLG